MKDILIMINNIPKISVLVICYNQVNLIRRAIDSLLEQIDYIFEICVSDDCSSDGTWEVLQAYYNKFPKLFKLNQNHPNVGIFENLEKTWTMPTGDVIYQLSGDDEVGERWFEYVINYIHIRRIDYKNELFCIYGDYMAKYPNGDAFVARNNLVATDHDIVSLALRKHVCNRSACFSIGILHRFIKVSNGKSYEAESSIDRQLQLISKANYYIPKVGNIYYSRIGVSAHMKTNVIEQRLSSMSLLRKTMSYFGYKVSKKDELYMSYCTELERKALNNTFGQVLTIVSLFLKSRDFSFGARELNFKRAMFALVRRLPHKTSIIWKI